MGGGDVGMEPTAQSCHNRPHQQCSPPADIPGLLGYAVALLLSNLSMVLPKGFLT